MRRRATICGILALALWAGAGCDSQSNDQANDDSAESSESGEEHAATSDTSANSEGIGSPIPGGTDARTLKFVYKTTVQPGDTDGTTEVFIPLAVDTEHQKVLERNVEGPWDGDVRTEETYGNKYWYASTDELPDEPKTVTITHRVRREVFRRDGLDTHADSQFPDGYKEKYDLFLQPNERVPTSGDLIKETADDAGLDSYSSPKKTARAIYDYVVDTMEYKKTGDGWGNGDTYWACSKKYGNCTDFHALFTSLARYKEIPARFEIGFPIPTDRAKGKIGGYHCWLKFYLPGVGWTPIDASEAKKHPKYKDMYFGTQPANRIRFTAGRDLELGDELDTGPLNYFVYPRVEVGDEEYDGIETEFSYEEIQKG